MIKLIATVAMMLTPQANADDEARVVVVRSENVVAGDVASLCEQVAGKQVLKVSYSYDPATSEARTFMPYAVGYTRAREMMVFGLQTEGYSRSASLGQNELPGWRNLRADQIAMIEKGDAPFAAKQPHLSDLRAVSQFACKNDLVAGVVR